MTREQTEFEVVDMIDRSSSVRAEVEKHGGVQREVDVWELLKAQTTLRRINLSRYPKSEELKAAVRRARRALAEVWDEMRVLR